MATVEERYSAATAYVRRAIDAVKPSVFYWVSPITGIASWYAGHEKTKLWEGELQRIEDRWLRAKSDAERAKVARDAELLADRVQEILPGAPQDRARTNLYKGEVQTHTEATSYLGEVANQAGEAWDWLKKKKDEATKKTSDIGKWLLVGGGVLLALKTLGYLTVREQSHLRMASDMEEELNATLEQVAELRDAEPAHFHVLTGLAGGYMPNDNHVYSTRAEAEDAAHDLAEEFREQGETVSGSAKDGFFTVGKNEYIEVVDCGRAECLRDPDQP
jgi:hypothetical protein